MKITQYNKSTQKHLTNLYNLKDIKDIYNYLNQDFKSTIEKGLIFELYLVYLLREAGYDAIHSGGKNDNGVDIEVYNGSKDPEFIIQAKNLKGTISNDELFKEFNKIKRKAYKVNKYFLISLNGFTKGALKESNGIIKLLTGKEYFEELLNTKKKKLDNRKGITLHSHNEYAYKNVISILKEKNRAVVIQPTGSGKMYILAKLVYENIKRNEKVLIIAPTNIIIKKIRETFPPGE